MKISGHEKSALFGFLKSLLGRAPKMGWDYLELKGHRCLITVEHQQRRDGQGVFAAIASLSPLPQGMGGGNAGRTPAAPVAPSPAPAVEVAPVEVPSVDGDEEYQF
ncbi:MAG: hypothetical protein JJU29_17835 [Verrucomicrobia bacterium]|nr:hypothetical protein [Verrucomicrobiota bacterium]MCH8513877.1 hypothetical protein [Kiritimatiellia bacterium]